MTLRNELVRKLRLCLVTYLFFVFINKFSLHFVFKIVKTKIMYGNHVFCFLKRITAMKNECKEVYKRNENRENIKKYMECKDKDYVQKGL